jgi:hypothetical protein
MLFLVPEALEPEAHLLPEETGMRSECEINAVTTLR